MSILDKILLSPLFERPGVLLFVLLIVGLEVWLILHRVIHRWKEGSLVWTEGRCSGCSQVSKGQSASFWICQVADEKRRGSLLGHSWGTRTIYMILERATDTLCVPCAKKLCRIHALGYAKWSFVSFFLLVCSIWGMSLASAENDFWEEIFFLFIIAFVLLFVPGVICVLSWLARAASAKRLSYHDLIREVMQQRAVQAYGLTEQKRRSSRIGSIDLLTDEERSKLKPIEEGNLRFFW